MKKPILKIKNLYKSYSQFGLATPVLQDISFSVEEGEFISISGASGSGKSTLLSILGLLDSPGRGDYYIKDQLVSELKEQALAHLRSSELGFVFQAFHLLDDLCVLDNVALPLKYAGLGPKHRNQRAQECLESVGLSDKADAMPNQLSGGQQQRVSIARALANQSGILLVDEPTGNLDSKNSDDVMSLLLKLNKQGTTLVLVTHDPRYATLANRTLLLHDGRMQSTVQNNNTQKSVSLNTKYPSELSRKETL